ncbi:MAG: hypothetical protein ABUT20_48490 [Bacteroidota bacterium]
MAVSAVDKQLLKYFTQLDEPQKRSLLAMLKSFVKAGNKKKEGASIDQYNQELNEAMKRISKGGFTTLAELEKEMQSW